MALGPGKYDDLCTLVREKTNADLVVVIIAGGDRGSGFSAQTESLQAVGALPEMLEDLAKQIRDDMAHGDLSAAIKQ